ncbi:hypothetical protein BDF14DRAFT_1886011 [Spinellus fusiger]|nr:hypothetical protein BDF14DRAFT_1886011 [Spinellus fusiger]
MSPLIAKDSKKRSALDVKSSRITKKPTSLSSPSLAVRNTHASILRKDRTSLTSSQPTDTRLPVLSGISPSKTIKKPSGEPLRPGTGTTRPPMATPPSSKTPRIQPTTTTTTTTTTRPPMPTPSSLRTPRIQPRKQNPIMPRSFKPEKPATTISDTVDARTEKNSFKSLDANVKRCVLDKKLNHQEHIEAVDEPPKSKTDIESDITEKDVETSEVAERVDDLETEEQVGFAIPYAHST